MRNTTARPILQAREMDPIVYRQMRIECATEELTLSALLKRMWTAYLQVKGGEPLATGGSLAQE